MLRKVLAIDDELTWRENFRLWIPTTVAEVHVAATPREAVNSLRRQHYDVVLLDLAMTKDSANRDNRDVQEYLSTRFEGTLYIIISATIRKAEVRDSVIRKNAFNVIFKPEADPDTVVEALLAAFEAIGDSTTRFIAEAKQKLIGGLAFESELIRALQTKGAPGFSRLMDSVLRRVAPVARHRFRPQLAIVDQVVLGILWSRQLGRAISLTLAHESVPREQANVYLSHWLGYDERRILHEEVYHHNVWVQIAEEASLADDLFELSPIAGLTNDPH
ncbi:MAG TPA: response regulator [Thermoanaerobaculia bacterium]|nr:response regulator [Thermoanaerobaculia bacterium]